LEEPQAFCTSYPEYPLPNPDEAEEAKDFIVGPYELPPFWAKRTPSLLSILG